MKILIIDDDEAVRKLFLEAIELSEFSNSLNLSLVAKKSFSLLNYTQDLKQFLN